MIDRYTIFSDFQEINKRYGLTGDEFTVPNYNASPSQLLPIVSNMHKKEISFFHWGVNKEWSNNNSVSSKLLSAEVPSLLSKTTLKSALLNKRCLIPANGFYCWKQYGKKRKTPHYFKMPGDEIFSLAGIWEEFDDMNGKTNYVFKIIERNNYMGVTDFGPFLPALISKENEAKWLDEYSSPDQLMEMLNETKAVTKLSNHPVSPKFSDPTINSKTLIQAQAQVDQLGNYTLFD